VNSDVLPLLSKLADELTVVTAFFNIGKFAKGAAAGPFFTPELYRQWMTAFALIENPVVIYVDNDDDLEYFRAVRRASRFSAERRRTHFVRVRRRSDDLAGTTELWTLSNETVTRVASIFGQSGYARHYPNTVVPRYALAMHAKYEVMQMAVRENPFRTRYFCWLDIGLFRDMTSPAPKKRNASASPSSSPTTTSSATSSHVIVPDKPTFLLYLPPNFTETGADNDSVAVCEVYDRQPLLTPRQIVYGNHVWIGGGFFVARVDVMSRWTREYLAGVRWMMDQRLLSTDQQVIYSMFNGAELGLRPRPTTKLLRYRSDGRYNDWFHLAYVARDQGNDIRRRRVSDNVSNGSRNNISSSSSSSSSVSLHSSDDHGLLQTSAAGQ
jgi:hypothetical protein